MRRSIIYLIWVIGFCSLLQGQTVRFVKQYNFGFVNGSYVSTNVLKKNNSYLLCGYGLNASQNQNYCLGVICTDSIGQQLWQNSSNAPGNFRYSNNTSTNAFQTIKDGNVLFTGEIDYSISFSKSCLVKLNKNNGDTLWVKQYSQVGDTSNLFCTSQLIDSSFLSIGYKYFDNGTQFFNRPFILKTDKNGNYKWHKYLWNTTATFNCTFAKLLNLNDKDFIVAGINYYTTPGQKAFILKIDTNNIIAYNKVISHLTFTYGTSGDIIKLNNGNILLSGSIITNHSANFSTTYLKPWLFEFDLLSGTQISSKTYGNEKLNVNEFDAVYQDPISNNIFALGTEWSTPLSGTLFTFNKFSGALDSLYTRYYDSGQGGTFASTSFLKTNDNGFAIACQIYPNTGQQQFWLMKTDTMGCDSAGGCVIPIGLNEHALTNNGFVIYPNPFKTELRIETDLYSASEEVKIKLVNALGLVVREQKLHPGVTMHTLNTKDFEAGVYFLQMFDGNKLVAVTKVVKE